MTISTKDCVAQLIVWTDVNYDSLPKGNWNFVGEKRLRVLEKGHTRASNWSRRAIKKDANRVYRLFECRVSMFTLDLMFLVVEEDNTIVDIVAGTREDFEHYFNKIGWNWGWED
jgi:hypothetical protein